MGREAARHIFELEFAPAFEFEFLLPLLFFEFELPELEFVLLMSPPEFEFMVFRLPLLRRAILSWMRWIIWRCSWTTGSVRAANAFTSASEPPVDSFWKA